MYFLKKLRNLIVIPIFIVSISCDLSKAPPQDLNQELFGKFSTPVAWSGRFQKIRVGEACKQPYAFSPIVGTTDENENFINNRTVSFSITEGSAATFSVSSGVTSGLTGTTESASLVHNGLYQNIFLYSNGTSTGVVWYSIKDQTANSTQAGEGISVILDEETDDYGGCTLSHERDSNNNLILGDNFADNSEDPSEEWKNLMVEVDYLDEINDDLSNILSKTKQILETGGFSVDFNISDKLIRNSDNMPSQFSRIQMHDILAATRNKNNMLHVVLATKYTDSQYGQAIHYYGDSGEGWTDLQCLRGATGETRTRYIDKVGVMVWTDVIKNTTFANSTWNFIDACSYILAHEIGHSLGITIHYNDLPTYNSGETSVMRYPEFSKLSFMYNKVNSFNGDETSYSPTCSINLREVLGIQTINVAN